MTKPKDFPNYYTPGVVKTHKMTEEEKKREWRKRRNSGVTASRGVTQKKLKTTPMLLRLAAFTNKERGMTNATERQPHHSGNG